jgi:hypothetical protein
MTRIESITVAPTTEKKTVPGRFEAALQGAARSVAATVIGAAELAVPAVPFGNVIAAAVRGASGGSTLSGRVLAGPAGAPTLGAPMGVGGGLAATANPVAGGAGGQGDLLEATRAMQQEAQAMNLQYLQLQERMQQESREFTTLSNVMKVKHDTARSAIGNIH